MTPYKEVCRDMHKKAKQLKITSYFSESLISSSSTTMQYILFNQCYSFQ